MAKVPTVRRFLLEDFASQKQWIPRLIEPLNTFIISVVTGLTNQLSISENMLAQINRVRVRTKAGSTLPSYEPTSISLSFSDADVNVAADTITIVGHGLQSLEVVRFSSTGILPSPLSSATLYTLIVVDADTIQLALSSQAVIAGTAVDLLSASGGGVHTLTLQSRAPAQAELFEPARLSVTFRAAPVFVVLGSVVEVSSSDVIQRQASSLDWSFKDGMVTIDHVAGLKPQREYDLVVYTSGG